MQDVEKKLTFNLQLFAGEKSEPATQKKRDDARKKGQVAKSGDIGTAMIILAGVTTLRTTGTMMFERMGNLVRTFLSAPHQWDGSPEMALQYFSVVVTEGLYILIPIFGLLMLIAFISQGAQVGVMLTWSNLAPKFSRVNPLEGFKRIFSKRSLVEFLKSVLKILIIGYLGYRQIRISVAWLPSVSYLDIMDTFTLVSDSVFSLALTIGMTLFLLAILDYVFQRYEFEQSIKMSKQEIKDEYKQSEGDPQIRSKVRQRQREMASGRMMDSVPSADVIITNPTHYAIALKYNPEEMMAPELVAKGVGTIALKIRELAEQHNVPTVENPPLARALYKAVEVNAPIPADLYPAVAEVLAFVYRLKRKKDR